MSQARKRWILGVGAVTVVAIVVAALFFVLPGESKPAAQAPAPEPVSATTVADKFLRALASKNYSAAGLATDAPADAEAALKQAGDVLVPNKIMAAWKGFTEPPPNATEAPAPFTITWVLGANRTWTYDSALTLVKTGQDWKVRWSPTIIHPGITDGRALAIRTQRTNPNAVVDQAGTPLLTWQAGQAAPVDPTLAPLLVGGMKRSVTQPTAIGAGQVVLVDQSGAVVQALYGEAPPDERGPAVTTLDVPTQKAAQAAVDSGTGPTMLVAIRPSTGDILAVAQNAAAGGQPKALNGLYPPGSTFKIVTASAVLDAGKATVDTVLPCPGSQAIGTRQIKNDGFDLGEVPLRKAFAQSCNTTFAGLAAEMPATSLPESAARFGLAADFTIPGITTQTGRVKPSGGTPEQVENSIGQGTVQASPFGMALASATVAKGGAVTPRLFTDLGTQVITGYQGPSKQTVTSLRTMMREVVTGGSAKALAGRGQVFGKTGTAQFGDGSHSHGWFTGYRGDLAFAVLVEDGGSSAPAVAVTGAFLGAVG